MRGCGKIFVCLSLLVVLGGFFVTSAEDRNVDYKLIDMHEYQNFLVGWDGDDSKHLYACIDSLARYKMLFKPAPLMNNKRLYSPAESLFATEQILLVARISTDPAVKVLNVDRIVDVGQNLTVYYTYKKADKITGAIFSSFLAIRVPSKKYATVKFVENAGKPVELKVAEGAWVLPANAPVGD